jgi:hypothetical protein
MSEPKSFLMVYVVGLVTALLVILIISILFIFFYRAIRDRRKYTWEYEVTPCGWNSPLLIKFKTNLTYLESRYKWDMHLSKLFKNQAKEQEIVLRNPYHNLNLKILETPFEVLSINNSIVEKPDHFEWYLTSANFFGAMYFEFNLHFSRNDLLNLDYSEILKLIKSDVPNGLKKKLQVKEYIELKIRDRMGILPMVKVSEPRATYYRDRFKYYRFRN